MPAAGELRTGQRQHAPFGIGTATGDAFAGVPQRAREEATQTLTVCFAAAT
jgi:hypothetical protein